MERWLASGLGHPEPEGSPGETFSMAIPPPNVTGVLHMGHALNGAVQDCLVRLHRMRGQRTKWVLGTDHAGIATQTQVERELRREERTREELGREGFVERVWRWRDDYGGRIVEQLKRLGATCDFAEERFTMDPAYARAVATVFVALHEQGLIYRDHYLVNWDPGSRSAISDLEVEEREGVVDTLYAIAYPLADGEGEVVVATVRPETMLADVAVAVHPDDERYRDLVGREVVLPLAGRRLPVIADEAVKPDFGTGCLKITPGHDPLDFEIGRRHGLPELSVIGEDGCLTAGAGPRFEGLPTLQARDAVVAALSKEDALRGTEPYEHTVPFSHRSGERIEPLVSLQWFMRMDELAAPAIDAVRDGRVRIHPEAQARRYVEWLEGIRPWCISRQLWWGHQIPVWYRGDETHVGLEPPAGEGWRRDPDVLDTWFSSALWPFATLGWPEETPELRAFYPTDVLSTARDILFLWVARMVMLGLRFTGDVPFEQVYVHPVIQAPDGRRMSKSLGTGIDPLDLIDGGPRPPVFAEGGEFPAYGADAVRFGLLAMSTTQDVRFSEDKVAQGRALTNKLFNATRYALLHVRDDVQPAPAPRCVEDRWILSRLAVARTDLEQRIDGYDFAKAALGLYDFVYGELCDWYLEFVKGREVDEALSAQLLYVLRETLSMAHPVIPFVTEELWDALPGTDGLLACATLRASSGARDEQAEGLVGTATGLVQAVRSWRERAGVRPGAVLPVRVDDPRVEEVVPLVERLARVRVTPDGGAPVAALGWEGITVEVLPSDAIDVEAAERRVEAKREELRREVARAEGKLANQGFVSKAPVPVVDAERAKLERLRAELDAL
ncbi:MAG: valine--tRNA ligase [Actinomycetota bacterium]|nr:valine--tRNA ligase [Actinomycetota bacterium]